MGDAYNKAATFADLRGGTIREAAERMFGMGALHWEEVEEIYAALDAQANSEHVVDVDAPPPPREKGNEEV